MNTRSLFNVNSFLNEQIKGLKIVHACYVSSRPYTIFICSNKDIYRFEVKRNAVPSGCILSTKLVDTYLVMDFLICKQTDMLYHYQLNLETQNSSGKGVLDGILGMGKMLLKDPTKLSFPSDTQIKLSPCGHFYSIEYIDGGFFEIYINNAIRGKHAARKIFTGAGYSLSWSLKRNIFAVISYCDDSKDSFDVNAEDLNNPISKAKLEKGGVKSVIVIYRIENKEKLRKLYVHDEYRCMYLYDQAPVLNV